MLLVLFYVITIAAFSIIYHVSHLSITLQVGNICSAAIILTEICSLLDSPYFSCIQIYSTATCIVFISLARIFANGTDQYFNLPHQKLGKFCKWLTIVNTFIPTFAMARVCTAGTTCPGDRKCIDNGVKMFINICIIPVYFLNLNTRHCCCR